MVLSSGHVFARNSSTTKSVGANEPIVQPGLVDLGCFQETEDQVAKLTNWSKINFAGGPNTLDAAVATVIQQVQSPGGTKVDGVDPSGTILNIGQISNVPLPYTSISDGLPVVKMGRTTCLTSGGIDAFDATGKVVYPTGVCNVVAGGTAIFQHQILVIGEAFNSTSGQTCTFAQSGDAGALVVTATDFSCPQAVGILFAGTPAAGTPFGPEISSTIVAVNPIGTILTKFGVTLVGQTCTPSAFAAEASVPMPQVSAAKRESIEVVRKVKNRHAARLMKMDEVTAVGIGAGDDADHAALNVYLSKDTPEIRAKIPAQIDGVAVHIKHAPKFQIL